MSRQDRRQSGATLVEIVVVVILAGILAGGIAVFLTAPFEGYRDVNRRARLVDAAESALRRMGRDVRRALPNSVRVGAGGTALELLYAADGGRYRRQGGVNPGPVDHGAPSDWLSFAASGDSSWNLLGRFEALSFGYGTPLAAGSRLAVFPTSTLIYTDAATSANPGLITAATNQITIADDGDEDQLQLASPQTFRFESPEQRVFVVSGPVSYLCDLATGRIDRYSAYDIVQNQPTSPAVAPLDVASSARVATSVATCSFVYRPGPPQRGGLLILELGLAEAGEQVRLLHQVHVENTP